jgi:hypothetical protein
VRRSPPYRIDRRPIFGRCIAKIRMEQENVKYHVNILPYIWDEKGRSCCCQKIKVDHVVKLMFSYSSVDMSPAALLLRLLLVVAVYILLPLFVQSYSPPGLPPSRLSSLSRRTSKKQLLTYAPTLTPLNAYSVSAGTAKDGSRPSSWRSKLPTPLERLASEFGLFQEGKI